jgi:hypothetical protein
LERKAALNLTTKETNKVQRGIYYFSATLVVIIGLILFFMPEQTETYFAWEIAVPLTAAFLGAAYLAAVFLSFMAARESLWARSRVAVLGVLVFSFITFIVTLIHFDRFHTTSTNPATLIITWTWILIYAIVPPMIFFSFIYQMRSAGAEPARIAELPLWFRLILGLQGLIMLGIGLALLLATASTAPLWLWELTPLTARAIGAWLIGMGITAIHSVIENDWLRLRPALFAYTSFAILQTLNLFRFPNAAGLDWSATKTWFYLGFMLSILLISAFGFWEYQKHKGD